MFNRQKTNSTKLAPYRLKIRKVIEFFIASHINLKWRYLFLPMYHSVLPNEKTNISFSFLIVEITQLHHHKQFILLLYEISAFRFHLDRIHSGTREPKFCWVYMGTVAPWICHVLYKTYLSQFRSVCKWIRSRVNADLV